MGRTVYTDLDDEVQGIVQDTSFTDTKILVEFNRGLWDIAERILVPKLQEKGDVTTSTSDPFVTMPTDFHRNLYRCYNATRFRKNDVYSDLRNLENEIARLDVAGEIYGVAESAGNLCYQRIPGSAQTLTLSYYEEPEELSGSNTTADYLPKSYHDDLLVQWACWKIYRQIEDDADNGPNTSKYKGLYEETIVKFALRVGVEPKANIPIPDDMDLDYYTT